jgi:hypothetical protein
MVEFTLDLRNPAFCDTRYAQVRVSYEQTQSE